MRTAGRVAVAIGAADGDLVYRKLNDASGRSKIVTYRTSGRRTR